MDLSNHKIQDYQSLLFHQAAVAYILEHPEGVQLALDTLDRWDSLHGEPRPLHDRWRKTLRERDWALALVDSELGNQLRQASPLGVVLPETTKMSIRTHIQNIKNELRQNRQQ